MKVYFQIIYISSNVTTPLDAVKCHTQVTFFGRGAG